MNDFKLTHDDPRLTAYALGELAGEEAAGVAAAVKKEPALQAVVAEVQARTAEPSLRPLFATIAMDETRHAELAYDLDRWFRSQLDAQAIAGLDAAREQAVVRLLSRLEAESGGCLLGRPRGGEALRLAGGLSDLYWS